MQHVSGPSLGQWWWDPESRRLRIEPDEDAGLDDISGTWTLDALGVVLDGLSRSRLERALDPARHQDRAFACGLGLSHGGAVRFVGEFDDTGAASGEVFPEVPRSRWKEALPGPGLEAFFQPIVSLATGEIAGFEALARWDGASPAESDSPNGTSHEALAPNMLIRASEALSAWIKKGAGRGKFVNVNLTGRDLARDDLPDLVSALVSGHGFEPGQLRLELTEQAALRDAEKALEITEALKAVGAGVILDDFGSGHSSFSWLAALPADGLKIDPELTRQLGNPRVDIILETVTLLASRLEMSATAEGIEDLKQIGLLRSLGFHYAQGFAFSRPMTSDDALALLESQGSGVSAT